MASRLRGTFGLLEGLRDLWRGNLGPGKRAQPPESVPEVCLVLAASRAVLRAAPHACGPGAPRRSDDLRLLLGCGVERPGGEPPNQARSAGAAR
jgi:hypothetical protein